LAADVAATNNLNLEAINPMPAELVNYVYALRRNIPLNLASEFAAEYVEAAYQVTDQQWFDYLVPVLTMAQQQMEQLGEMLGVVSNVLRSRAQAAAG
jgi:hypothetical protein